MPSQRWRDRRTARGRADCDPNPLPFEGEAHYVNAMVRFLFRLAAMIALAIAVIFGVIDAARSVASTTFAYTPLGQSWLDASPATLDAVKAFAEQKLWAPLWDPVMVNILLAPGFAVFLVLSFLLHLAGHRPARRLGRLAFEE